MKKFESTTIKILAVVGLGVAVSVLIFVGWAVYQLFTQ